MAGSSVDGAMKEGDDRDGLKVCGANKVYAVGVSFTYWVKVAYH